MVAGLFECDDGVGFLFRFGFVVAAHGLSGDMLLFEGDCCFKH